MIRKRGKLYSFEFMESGERYFGTFNGKNGIPCAATKQEARDRESEIRIAARNGTFRKEAGLEDFGKFFDAVYMAYSKEHKTDWKHDEFRGEVLKRFFHGKTFSQITPMLVVGFINQRLKSLTKRKLPRSPVTVHKEVALLSSVFRMAMQEDLTHGNPCLAIPRAVRRKLPARNKRDRFLTNDEETRLFAQLIGRRCHMASIVRFDLETGLRKAELCRLEVEHVNLSNTSRYLTINNRRLELMPGELIVTRSKNGRPRTIPLTAEARRIAEAKLDEVTTTKYLFTSFRTGGMIAEIKTAFTAAVRDAGLEDFRFHDLRRTFSTRLNEAGVDPFTIRDLLGHSSVTMTADYTRTSHERRRQAIEAMSRERENFIADYVKIPA